MATLSMRKLYLLLLLLPAVFGHHEILPETKGIESELPEIYSNSFSLSEVDIELDAESYFEIEINNEGTGPLLLTLNYPNFLNGKEHLEIEDSQVLRISADGLKNSYGIVEFESPDSSLLLPVVYSLRDEGAFDSFEISMGSDVYFAGDSAIVNVRLTDDDSTLTKYTILSLTLLSKDNQKVFEITEKVEVDALFDGEIPLSLPEYLSKGDYVLFVEAEYDGLSDYDSSLFTLDAEESSNYWMYLLLVVVIGLFIFLVHNSHRHLSNLRKIHHKHSLSIKKHHASRAKVDLVEKKLSSIRAAYLEGAISKKNHDSAVKKLRDRLKLLRDSVKRGPK